LALNLQFGAHGCREGQLPDSLEICMPCQTPRSAVWALGMRPTRTGCYLVRRTQWLNRMKEWTEDWLEYRLPAYWT